MNVPVFHTNGLSRMGAWTRVVLVALAVQDASVSFAQEPFRKVPRDETIQPLTPTPGESNATFVGNATLTAEQLRTALAEPLRDIQESGLTRARADDAAYFLGVHYRKQGFADADVQYAIQGPRLVLTIREGPRAYLRKVIFEGAASFPEDTLYDYMIGGTAERLQKEPKLFPFVEADVKTGVATLRGFYEQEGFLDAVVMDPAITLVTGKTQVDVRVRVVEGPRYTFGEILFTGTPVFGKDELIGGLGEKLTEPYTPAKVEGMQRNLEFFFKQRGYYAAKVAATSDPASHVRRGVVHGERKFDRQVGATFAVTPGPLYRFDGVTVTGLDRLKPAFIENRFRQLHGDVYSPEALDETYRSLLRTGLFRNLRIESVPLPSNEILIRLTAEEAKAKEVGFSLGFSSYEGPIAGLRLADRNLLGLGRPLTFDLEVSGRAYRTELLYVDPWLFESQNSLRARLYAQTREEEGYSKTEVGVRADLNRKLTKKIEVGTFAQIESVEIGEESAIKPEFLGSTSYQIASLGVTANFDYRDSPTSPSRGWIFSTAFDADAIAGDVAFGRGTARFSYYVPLPAGCLLALGVRGGVIYPVTGVPIDERFFNGGGTTVRSFAERELGPKDPQGYPVGGQVFTVSNVEVNFPIRDALLGAVFIDAGNVISAFEDAGFDETRFAVGLGARYRLPIGPIRLDVAVNPDPAMDEAWGAVHFSFGFAF